MTSLHIFSTTTRILDVLIYLVWVLDETGLLIRLPIGFRGAGSRFGVDEVGLFLLDADLGAPKFRASRQIVNIACQVNYIDFAAPHQVMVQVRRTQRQISSPVCPRNAVDAFANADSNGPIPPRKVVRLFTTNSSSR